MSRRSLLTVRRVVFRYITAAILLIPMVTGIMCTWYLSKELFAKLVYFYFWGAGLIVVITTFAYFKVFRIMRNHQRRVQTNATAIERLRKNKKTVFTILHILGIFVLTYVPCSCFQLAFSILQDYQRNTYRKIMTVCVAVVLSSPFLNPLLYYWRIKEIREGVKCIARKVFCKGNGLES